MACLMETFKSVSAFGFDFMITSVFSSPVRSSCAARSLLSLAATSSNLRHSTCFSLRLFSTSSVLRVCASIWSSSTFT